jgi:hypothetical protein
VSAKSSVVVASAAFGSRVELVGSVRFSSHPSRYLENKFVMDKHDDGEDVSLRSVTSASDRTSPIDDGGDASLTSVNAASDGTSPSFVPAVLTLGLGGGDEDIGSEFRLLVLRMQLRKLCAVLLAQRLSNCLREGIVAQEVDVVSLELFESESKSLYRISDECRLCSQCFVVRISLSRVVVKERIRFNLAVTMWSGCQNKSEVVVRKTCVVLVSRSLEDISSCYRN